MNSKISLKCKNNSGLIKFFYILNYRVQPTFNCSCAKFAMQISVHSIYIIGSSENFPII